MKMLRRASSFAQRGFATAKTMYLSAMVFLVTALAAIPAFAQTGPDVSAIESEFDTYKVAVVGLVIAFAVVLWAIKASGLLKPR